MSDIWWAYLWVLVGTTLLCTGLTLTLSTVVDHWLVPRPRGRLYPNVADLGSSVIVVFIVAILATSNLRPLTAGREGILVLLAVLAVLLTVELTGTLRGMFPSWHIGAEISATVIICSTGMGVQLVSSRTFNILLSIIWVVTIVNAFSLTDRLPGFAAGATVITGLTLFSIASTNGQILVSTLAIGLAGCTLGFCIATSRKKLRLMGHGSIRTVGFLIAFLSIQIDGPINREESIANAILPIVICSYVLFYFALSIVASLLAKISWPPSNLNGFSDQLFVTRLSSPMVTTCHLSSMFIIGLLSYAFHHNDTFIGSILLSFIGVICITSGSILTKVLLRTHNGLSHPEFSEQI